MARKTRLRLLVDIDVDGEARKCNDVVVVDSDTAKTLVAQGAADDSKEAVAYALELEQNSKAPAEETE